MIKITIGTTTIYIDKTVAEQHYPHLLVQSQDNMETPEKGTEKPATDEVKELSQVFQEVAEEVSPHKIRRKVSSKKVQ